MKHITSILVPILIVLVFLAAQWGAFFFLWNYVAVAFGLPELTFWQSVGLLLLLGLVKVFMFKNKKDN